VVSILLAKEIDFLERLVFLVFPIIYIHFLLSDNRDEIKNEDNYEIIKQLCWNWNQNVLRTKTKTIIKLLNNYITKENKSLWRGVLKMKKKIT
jgi:hypothetical protein